jgi:hypothetical protein
MKESSKPTVFESLPVLSTRSGVFELIGQTTREDVELAAHTVVDPEQSDVLRRNIARTNSTVALALLSEAHNPGIEFASQEEAILHGMRVAIAALDRADLRAAVAASNLAS